MHSEALREQALSAMSRGLSASAISELTGLSRSTLRYMRDHPVSAMRLTNCPRCSDSFSLSPSYAYLLGMYLGDGCISHAARTTTLRISCADAWPGVMDECAAAVAAVSSRPVYRVRRSGCTDLATAWKHWPCLFPQHGPGMKHMRPIVLADWQQQLILADPRPLIRGLLQSDGCRSMNTVHRALPSGVRTYSYSRYLFSNMSTDILRIYTDALDILGIAWRQNRFNSISVARREAVAALDAFVGPKC